MSLGPLKTGMDHGMGQIFGWDADVWVDVSKYGVQYACETVDEIGFFSRCHRVDVTGPEDVDTGKTHLQRCLFSRPFVA